MRRPLDDVAESYGVGATLEKMRTTRSCWNPRAHFATRGSAAFPGKPKVGSRAPSIGLSSMGSCGHKLAALSVFPEFDKTVPK